MNWLRRDAPPRDPTVEAAVTASYEKASQANQLIAELKSRKEVLRLERARLSYDERLHGPHTV